MSNLKLFKSSAGSGKTFTLVKEYLLLVLRAPDDFRAILAITFTNKAAEEMKSRIVEALVDLSSGEKGPLYEILEKELPKLPIQVRAEKALKNILHDYSNFSVSTIDSFFQKILRALAREIHLPLKMEVEVSTDDALLSVTEALFREIGNDEELTDWLTDLAMQKIDLDKGWNIESDISLVAKEIFRESSHHEKILSRSEIRHIYNDLRDRRKLFVKKMEAFGREAISAMSNASCTVDDFSYKSGGVAGYFQKIISPKKNEDYAPGDRAIKGLDNSDAWFSKTSPRKTDLTGLVESTLIPILQKANQTFSEGFRDFMTADEVLKKIYLFGLVNDLQSKFREYRRENNVILLADTTRLLSDVIEGNDTPFIYEKTGNRFKHLLIDEFQDTSLLQWHNLMPLVINTLGSGFITLVVGDAKQSIYRWRGGNMNLLIRDIFIDLIQFRSLFQEEALSTNYRSKREIVHFNNTFFETSTEIISTEPAMKDHLLLGLAYGKDLAQAVAPKNDIGGYVEIGFIDTDEIDTPEEEEKASWKDEAMRRMLGEIRNLVDPKNNYAYRDIAILVRSNIEGNQIATFLLENGIEKIISPDSLMLSSSPKVTFLLNVFRFLSNQENEVARAELLYYYARFISHKEISLHSVFSDHKNSPSLSKKKKQSNTLFETDHLHSSAFNDILPDSFTAHLTYLANLPVYELSEQLIRIFSFHSEPDAFIQRFQDLVLEYNVSSDSSLDGFLNWWDSSDTVSQSSVITPENEDAIRIMTIHRSKGLQFPILFIPFAEWDLTPKSNQLIWLETPVAPFNELGKTALMTSSKLLMTHYKDGYQLEVNQTMVDNLNLLYVAFTRAEEKLWIYCPIEKEKKSGANELNATSKLIYRCATRLGLGGEKTLVLGENTPAPIRKEKSIDIVSDELQMYPSNRWQEKLALSTHSNDLIELLEDKKLTKINYGILIHALLAEIQFVDEIKKALDKFVFTGMINEKEKAEMQSEVSSILAEPEIAAFFDPSASIKSERELILPDGELLRPDRVLIGKDETLVVDFKSGQRQKKHEHQITRYAEVLRQMGYPNVKSKLVYLAERKVVEV